MTQSIRRLLPALLVLMPGAVGTASAVTCGGPPGPVGTIELKVGAITRTFVVRLPAATDARTPGPVIFAFHPFGMNAQYMQGRVPIPRVWPEAIAIYPQGFPRLGGGAGSFQPSWQTAPGELDDRDVVFFDAMLDWLRANHCFDETRVFVMGYSNGARLVSVLACERAKFIAGVAIASGSLSCTPPEPRPVVLSHGTQDGAIAYERAVEAGRAWASRNGCRTPPKSGIPGCFAADSCSTTPVMLCTYDGGHEYNEPFTRTLVEFLKAAVKK